MQEFVARLNIEHFLRKLAGETDEAKRDMLRRLLAEEKAKLAAIVAAKERKPTPQSRLG
jgi:hypothetical protein